MTDKPVMKTDEWGNKFWYLNGKIHREDGPAVEYSSGTKFWYLNGKKHREDGPAVEYIDGGESWYLNGERHREDGPAVELADGYKEWYLNGEEVTKEEVMGKSTVKLGKTVRYDNLFDVDWSKFEWGKSPTSFIPTVDTSDNVKTSDGGPSSYYDMPFQDWVTLNDQMEYLAQNKWGIYAIHLKDVFKGLGRWGDKSGTTPLYDTKKGIYYFCRVMKMMTGAKGLREYLQSILDDPQFKEQNK